jgi:hypothetical protein
MGSGLFGQWVMESGRWVWREEDSGGPGQVERFERLAC